MSVTVYCWDGPLKGQMITAEQLPLRVPLPPNNMKTWVEDAHDPLVVTFREGKYDALRGALGGTFGEIRNGEQVIYVKWMGPS